MVSTNKMEVDNNNSEQNKGNKTTIIEQEDSLNVLNKKVDYSYDFDKDSKLEKFFGGEKKEKGITATILVTMFIFLFFLFVIYGIYHFVFVLNNIKLITFDVSCLGELDAFNSELGKFLLIMVVILIIVCTIFAIMINLSVKLKFIKSYLSKTNVYVYDVFLSLLNMLVFSVIGMVFFNIINKYHSDFLFWYDTKIINPEVNLEVIGAFKYIIVIIVALFMSLNSFRGITIVYNKHRVIFENHS